MTIIVIAGGLSHERDISLRSGRRVSAALREVGYDVVETDVTAELLPFIEQHPDAVVVPMLHGGLGEDGALRSVLQALGVPFVGATGSSSRLTFDKSIASPTVAAAGIATPRQVALPQDIFRELGAAPIMSGLARHLGFPLVVKPANSGSALGVSLVQSADELPSALVSAFAYGPTAVVEEFVPGTEVAVTVLDEGGGPVALPAVEIRASSGMYDYEARYTAGMTRFVTPAVLTADVSARVAELAVAAHQALGLRHWSRIDVIVRPDGTPVFIEGNVAPGMTETSLAPLAFEAAGRTIGDVFARLIEVAR
ncbi:D-alanine--D-alanine ligase [Tessaracoccus sp. OH4464_COT-324]|uniref:D-alanine--D-alanine ligase family protein n=1 Tax=Tessaracoccus sp. OH4464_COT-324 TaxID=2491059 RepID=UPI000F632EAA|nr:D-alanine--D-alanine ligase [Tessaracoccus sp. OH4464_COT-324]RRD46117.1 D-alanine--D-alanine ligase [Tessaracoccus sp. OH4464_COT-324]